jgi:hypothetical protein
MTLKGVINVYKIPDPDSQAFGNCVLEWTVSAMDILKQRQQSE